MLLGYKYSSHMQVTQVSDMTRGTVLLLCLHFGLIMFGLINDFINLPVTIHAVAG